MNVIEHELVHIATAFQLMDKNFDNIRGRDLELHEDVAGVRKALERCRGAICQLAEERNWMISLGAQASTTWSDFECSRWVTRYAHVMRLSLAHKTSFAEYI